MHDAALLYTPLLLVLFSDVDGKRSKLRYICENIYWYILGSAANGGVAQDATGWHGGGFWS